MYVAVEVLYRHGVKIRPQWPPLVGQLHSETYRGVPVLYLWPLDWVHNTAHPGEPLAMLWHPVLGRVGHTDLLVRGLEAVGTSGERRWHAQKWLCHVMEAQAARDHLKPRLIAGPLPVLPDKDYPPHDPDNPFG